MRMFHWLFALSFTGAYLTAESEHWRVLHVTLGYILAGLLVFRLLYGLLGPRQNRLSALWNRLRVAPDWLRSVARAPSLSAIPWRPGQNLVMTLALVCMLALVLPLTLSGYATFNEWDLFLGEEVFEELHEFFGNLFLLVVLAHLGLLAGLSVLRRNNLALPMLTGRLPGPGPSPVQKNRTWLAALLLAAVLAFAVASVLDLGA